MRKTIWLLAFAAVAFLAVACSDSGSQLETPLVEEAREESDDDSFVAISNTLPEAPEFPGGHTWFNVASPLSLEELRGKVVLLDFWTSGCINCQQIVPDLDRLEAEFGDALVVIGVHSGKYDREQEDASVQQSTVRYGLKHPVVNDPDFIIWSLHRANAWPTLVLIDPNGRTLGLRAGEGVYDAFQPVIADVVADFDEADLIDRTPIELDLEAVAITSAVLSQPSTVLADEVSDRLFIADAGHNRVLISTLSGELQSVIGSGTQGSEDGSFDEASFDQPQGFALSPDGNTLYIADTRNHLIRAANLLDGTVETIAGTGERSFARPSDNTPATETALASPWGLILDDDVLYIAMAGVHQLWTMDIATNQLAVFAGSGREGIDDGPRLQATLAQPSGLTTDGTNLYWTDPESSAIRSVPIQGDGDVTTLVGTGLFDFGDRDGVGTDALLEHPQGIGFVDGTLFVADTYNHKLRTVDPTTTVVVTIAGGDEAGFADGRGIDSLLNEPNGISRAGDLLYFADANNHVVRTWSLTNGTISTLGLSNLSVLAQDNDGDTIRVSLEGQTVGPDTTELRIRLTTPEGFQLI
jgi:thiol-disulfide isomerase/thioredoxin